MLTSIPESRYIRKRITGKWPEPKLVVGKLIVFLSFFGNFCILFYFSYTANTHYRLIFIKIATDVTGWSK